MREPPLRAERPLGGHSSPNSASSIPHRDTAESAASPRIEPSFFENSFRSSPSSSNYCYATGIHDANRSFPRANAAVNSQAPSYQQPVFGSGTMTRADAFAEPNTRHDQLAPLPPRIALEQRGCHGLRGIEKFIEASHVDVGASKLRGRGNESMSPDNRIVYSPPFPTTNAAFSPPSMTSMKLPEPELFPRFGGYFADSEGARRHRQQSNRRSPHRPCESDHTITDIKNNRHWHVKRIYDAMTRPDAARDNPGSVAMKRWVRGPSPYEPALVEAYAHKVLDCLIENVELGFRGWSHNDYFSEDRKGGEDEDQDMSCADRLQSIIQGLEEEKTICEDMMASACQIRMFVNAPRAYAQRKFNNRVGNSKRGKTKKDEDSVNIRSKKIRRLTTRPPTRSHATLDQSGPLGTSPGAPLPQGPYFHNHSSRTMYPSPPSQVAASPFLPPVQDYSGLVNAVPMPMSPPPNMGIYPFTMMMMSSRQLHAASTSPSPQHAHSPTTQQHIDLSHCLPGIDPVIMSSAPPDELYTEPTHHQLAPQEAWHEFIVAGHLASPEIGKTTKTTPGLVTNIQEELNIDSFRDCWEDKPNTQPLSDSQIAKRR